MNEPRRFYTRSDLYELGYHRAHTIVYDERKDEAVRVCIPVDSAVYTVVRWSSSGKRDVSRVSERDILVVPASQPHTVRWHRSAAVVTLQLRSELLRHVSGADIALDDSLVLDDPLLTSIAVELASVLDAQKEAVSQMLCDAVATIVAHRITAPREWHIAPSRPERRFSSAQVNKVNEFLEEHLEEPIPLEVLAGVVGMSKWHFMRRFTTTFKKTPHRVVTERRLARACRLLANPQLSITQVALEVGMSHSHFSRTFLGQYGLSPSEFRAELERQSEPPFLHNSPIV